MPTSLVVTVVCGWCTRVWLQQLYVFDIHVCGHELDVIGTHDVWWSQMDMVGARVCGCGNWM